MSEKSASYNIYIYYAYTLCTYNLVRITERSRVSVQRYSVCVLYIYIPVHELVLTPGPSTYIIYVRFGVVSRGVVIETAVEARRDR